MFVLGIGGGRLFCVVSVVIPKPICARIIVSCRGPK
jgi:hypothetical protein